MSIKYESAADDNTFEFESEDDDLEDNFSSYSLKATFSEFACQNVQTIGQINFGEKCLAARATATPQQNPAENSYDGPIEWKLNEFTVDPEGCLVDYECRHVTQAGLTCDQLNFDGIFDGDDTDGEIDITLGPTDYENGTVNPGEYDVQICGAGRLSELDSAEAEDCVTIKVTVKDPCDPPAVLRLPTYQEQFYTLTDDSKAPYIMQDATIDPPYCPFTTVLEVSNLQDGSSALTWAPVDDES